MLQDAASKPPDGPPLAVLDTNVVLALWWFEDPRTRPLRAAIESGRLICLACPVQRQELHHVLGRLTASADRSAGVPGPGRDAAAAMRVLDAFDRVHAAAATPAATARLRCTDGSDQVFIDLALGSGARWLFSRDRAVLRLRRRAAALGLQIRPPEGWDADADGPDGPAGTPEAGPASGSGSIAP